MQALGLGHNQPPSQIDTLGEACAAVGAWLKITPVVTTEEEARAGKPHVDRLRLGLQDMEAELQTRTKPKLDEINVIRDEYRSIRKLTETLLEETKDRINTWAIQEEQHRRKCAEEARQRAEEAERLARSAEAAEQAAVEESRLGVETDIAEATKEADEKFTAFEKAQRELARAQRETKVKVGGGFGRALSSRFKETLVVTDPQQAINKLGWSSRVVEAILTEAREYRRRFGHLPDGVMAETERKM